MDMGRHLRRWLNDAALARLDGVYEGTIGDVVEEQVRNRFTAQREIVPVVVFADGWRLIPNITMRTALVEMFGSETDHWRGARVRVHRTRREIVNKGTGETKTVWVKVIERLGQPHATCRPITDDDIEWGPGMRRVQ
jgi:hypothetical protein